MIDRFLRYRATFAGIYATRRVMRAQFNGFKI